MTNDTPHLPDQVKEMRRVTRLAYLTLALHGPLSRDQLAEEMGEDWVQNLARAFSELKEVDEFEVLHVHPRADHRKEFDVDI